MSSTGLAMFQLVVLFPVGLDDEAYIVESWQLAASIKICLGKRGEHEPKIL